MSAWQAYLPSKQQSHYGEEYGQYEEHIGGAHHCVVGQLIWLSSNLADVEAHWEYESSHTEQDHCGGKERESKRVLSINAPFWNNDGQPALLWCVERFWRSSANERKKMQIMIWI